MDEQTVFIVDDDAAVRDSIEELVDSVGLRSQSYSSAQAFLDACSMDGPGCLVLDVRMAGMSGLALQEELHQKGFRMPIIVVTGHGDVPMAVQALQGGAVDFIEKPYRDQRLLDAINAALEAEAKARDMSAERAELESLIEGLTQREREVLDRLLDDASSKQIASDLKISPRTVEAHRSNLLHKLGFDSVKELVVFLAQQG